MKTLQDTDILLETCLTIVLCLSISLMTTTARGSCKLPTRTGTSILLLLSDSPKQLCACGVLELHKFKHCCTCHYMCGKIAQPREASLTKMYWRRLQNPVFLQLLICQICTSVNLSNFLTSKFPCIQYNAINIQ